MSQIRCEDSGTNLSPRSVKPPGKHLQQYDREPGRMPSLQVVRRKISVALSTLSLRDPASSKDLLHSDPAAPRVSNLVACSV